MEELLLAIFEFIFEFAVNFFLWFPWDIFLWWRERRTPSENTWTVPVMALLLGAGIGGFSLLVLPHALLGHEALGIANLFLTPLLCALLARFVALRRTKRGSESDAWLHFWFALLFGLALLFVRFVGAERAG